jgi:hypothetical protein
MRPMNEQIALFNDAIAILRAHAVLLESVARVVEGPDPWPADLEHWIGSHAITQDTALLAEAFRDAARSAEKKAGFIFAFLRDGNASGAILGVSTAGSSIGLLLEHRAGLGGEGCQTLPSASSVLADVEARLDQLFPPDETEFYTPQVKAFQQWLNTYANLWS